MSLERCSIEIRIGWEFCGLLLGILGMWFIFTATEPSVRAQETQEQAEHRLDVVEGEQR